MPMGLPGPLDAHGVTWAVRCPWGYLARPLLCPDVTELLAGVHAGLALKMEVAVEEE